MAHLLTNRLHNRMTRKGLRVERDDIFQQVAIVWMRCRDGYDPNHGASFSTYWWKATELSFGSIARHSVDRINNFAVSLDTLGSADDEDGSLHEVIVDPRQDVEAEADTNLRLRKIKENYPIIGLFMEFVRDPPEELQAELRALKAHQEFGASVGSSPDQVPTQLTPESLSRIFGFNWRSRLIMRQEIEDAARLLD